MTDPAIPDDPLASDGPWAVAMELSHLTKTVDQLTDAVLLLAGTQQGTCEDFVADAGRTLVSALDYDEMQTDSIPSDSSWARISRLRIAIREALYQLDKATGGSDEDNTT